MRGPLISVVVTVYNIQDYLGKCIESILAQTYEDMDIILVDDGSTDGSLGVCKKYALRDARIRIITHENRGVAEARNTGIAEAKGEYIMFVDGDDTIHPQQLETLYRAAIEYDSYLVKSLYRKVTEFEDFTQVYDYDSFNKRYLDRDEAFRLACTDTNTIVPVAKLVHRSLYEGVRYPTGRIHEDEFITYQLIFKAKGLVIVDAELYNYMYRVDSITNSPFSEKRYDACDALNERIYFAKASGINMIKPVKSYLMRSTEFIRRYRDCKDYDSDKYLEYVERFNEDFRYFSNELNLVDRMDVMMARYCYGIFVPIHRTWNRLKVMRSA